MSDLLKLSQNKNENWAEEVAQYEGPGLKEKKKKSIY